jgi:hypothetical protein
MNKMVQVTKRVIRFVEKKVGEIDSGGLYYKTIRIRNLQKNGQILSQASAFLLSVTNTIVLTNTLAYCRIRRLQIHNVFIVQAPGVDLMFWGA